MWRPLLTNGGGSLKTGRAHPGRKCQGRMKEIKDRPSMKRDDFQEATAKEDLEQEGEEEPADQEES